MDAPIVAGSRASPLAKAQVEELAQEILQHHPRLTFIPIYVDTTGDIDQKTSLRTLGKTDFFTKELDDMLLEGKCRIAIHSAKDLPDPIPEGLTIAAITKGVDPSDSLVMKQGQTLKSLPPRPTVATSSERREDAVRDLLPDAAFIDIRGPIQKRLHILDEGKADCVVLAEAALIRLGLTHLNRIKLPGDTVALQGQLAVVVRSDDEEMLRLFAPIDTR